MKRALFFSLGLLTLSLALPLTSCRRHVAPPTPSAAAPAPRFVLIRSAATLYSAPREGALAMNRYAKPPGFRVGIPEPVDVYEWVATRGEWMELKSLSESPWDKHCHGHNAELEGLRLRLFVRQVDQVMTTTQEVTVNYADGTAITLASGVPLWAQNKTPQLYSVAERPYSFLIHLSDKFVGWSYRPSVNFKAPEPPQRIVPHSVASQGHLKYGQTGTIKVGDNYSALAVTKEQPVANGILATIPDDCVQLKVLLQPEDIVDFGGYLGMVRGSKGDGTHHVRSGSQVYWPDGTLAGEATQDVSFTREIAPMSGRRCFEKALRYIGKEETSPSPLNFIRLCADKADVL